MDLLVLAALAQAVVCGAFAAYLAGIKGWQPVNWFALGFLFSLAGLVAAAGLPDRAKASAAKEPSAPAAAPRYYPPRPS